MQNEFKRSNICEFCAFFNTISFQRDSNFDVDSFPVQKPHQKKPQ